MEKMAKKVCLDTSVIISVLKQDKNSGMLINKLENCEVYISAITVFELFLRKSNLEIVEDFVSKLIVLPLDEFSAKLASELHKKQIKSGNTVDLRDLFIAAIAMSNNCSLLTLDLDDFRKIKELTLMDV